jgi:hypothetical protein
LIDVPFLGFSCTGFDASVEPMKLEGGKAPSEALLPQKAPEVLHTFCSKGKLGATDDKWSALGKFFVVATCFTPDCAFT